MVSVRRRILALVASDLVFEVDGFPPSKNEAVSLLGERHPHRERVISLLEAARQAMAAARFEPFASEDAIGFEVIVRAATGSVPWDATNYLGGIADVLEEKSRRGPGITHLGPLREVHVYANDRQIREITYRQEKALMTSYAVRLWRLDEGEDVFA